MDAGIIGFFDILGYQSFLENNQGDGSRQVVSALVRLEESMPNEMIKAFSHYQTPTKAKELIDQLKWLVFSDTIMLYTPFAITDSSGQRANRWLVMHFACLLLWRRMFEYGLPLRGIIHTGEFLVEKNCFAGRAIVEAYRFSQDLNLSVCVYSPEAFLKLIHQANEPVDPLLWSWIPTQIFEYQVPRKTTPLSRFAVINPLTLILEDQEQYFTNDLRQVVHECFLKHNKDIPDTVQQKLLNTEQYLRASRFIITTDQKEAAKRMLRFKKQ